MNLFAGRNTDADVENQWVTEPEREGGMNREFEIDVYALPCVKQIACGNLLCRRLSELCGDLDGWKGGAWERGGSKRVRVYVIHTVDSFTALQKTLLSRDRVMGDK